jgi:hypothetical protein
VGILPLPHFLAAAVFVVVLCSIILYTFFGLLKTDEDKSGREIEGSSTSAGKYAVSGD